MDDKSNSTSSHVRYEPHEKPPHAAAAAMAAQIVTLIVAPIMVTPLVIAQAAGLDAAQTSWIIFAALIAGGISTWLQLVRKGPIGSGYVLFVGSNVAFVSVATAAIQAGGLPLLAVLGATSALVTFAFTRWMPLMRRFLTPALGGTVLMLMALSVGPVLWKMLNRPGTAEEIGAPHGLVFLVTLVSIVSILLFTRGLLRLWAPLLGVMIGSAVAAPLGLIDVSRIAAAPLFGLPASTWPGLDLSFGLDYWSLLPAFVLISLVGCMETFADGVSVQRTAHRKVRPIDFRAVQGAINADGLGSTIAALLGTVPNTVYSTSTAVVEITGFAARRVGLWGGLFMITFGLSPKLAALVAAMPAQVTGAYLLVLVVLIFAHGVRLVTEQEMTFEIGLAVCLGFWLGFGAQSGGLLNTVLPDWMQIIFSNGTTVGGVTAIIILLISQGQRIAQSKRTVPLDPNSVFLLRKDITEAAYRFGWDKPAEHRLTLAIEEAILLLCESEEKRTGQSPENKSLLRMTLVERDGEAEVEFVTGPLNRNFETTIQDLPSDAQAAEGSDLSARLLARIAKGIRHLQYRQGDYLTFRVQSGDPEV
jgi:xanthine permease XanP